MNIHEYTVVVGAIVWTSNDFCYERLCMFIIQSNDACTSMCKNKKNDRSISMAHRIVLQKWFSQNEYKKINRKKTEAGKYDEVRRPWTNHNNHDKMVQQHNDLNILKTMAAQRQHDEKATIFVKTWKLH